MPLNCRNSAGDLAANSPDSEQYEVEAVQRVGPHLVMKVKYSNCQSYAYEGNKVMVFLNVTEVQVLRWRKIDPHFRDSTGGSRTAMPATEAPSPAARFPASAQGWVDAVAYAAAKAEPKMICRGGSGD